MEKIKILVVDDEERMQKLLSDFLKMKDYEVLLAGNGEEAIDLFFKEKSIALIILDVMMPKMDGWTALKTIREHSKVPVIMLTARSEENDELKGFDYGANTFPSPSPRRFWWREWKLYFAVPGCRRKSFWRWEAS